MEADPSLIQSAIIFTVLLAFLTLVQTTKTSVLNISETKLKDNDLSSKKITRILKLTDHEHKFTLAMNTLSTLLVIALTLVGFYWLIPDLLLTFELPLELGLWYFLFAAVFIFITLLFGFFLSFYWGHTGGCQIALPLSGLASLFFAFMTPLVAVIELFNKALCFVLRIDTKLDEQNQIEEEIKQLIEDGENEGSIEDSEREMIHNIFDFNDMPASTVMTHRTEMFAIDIEEYTLDEIIEIATVEGYSRIPVYREDTDHIEGILYVKDLLVLLQQDNTNLDLKDFLRDPLFVPETANCADLFELLTNRKTQMAIVIDEYGGTAGIVTVEDLVESIVGNIQDEYDEEEFHMIQIDDHTYAVEGNADLEEVCESLNIVLDDVDMDTTVGGFIAEQIGHIPDQEEEATVEIGDLVFKVDQVEDNRITKVTLTFFCKDDESAEEE